MRVCVSLCVCPMVSFMSLIRLALFTGLFYNTDVRVYFTRHGSRVCEYDSFEHLTFL